MKNIKSEIQIAISAAKYAGTHLLHLFKSSYNNKSYDIQNKGVQDIVTQADIEAETIIKTAIKENFPEANIISEESDFKLEHSATHLKNAWIVDPLDGTRNFSIGNPNFVVSIGYVNEQSTFEGVIYYPILDQTFIATDGKAYFNEKVLTIKSEETLENSIIAFWDKREKDPSWNKPDIYNRLLGKVKVLRVFGASAMEKAWVANGQIDAYIGNSSSIFGATAGVALIRNAGGVCYNFEGEDWKLGDVGIVCGNKVLVEKILKELS